VEFELRVTNMCQLKCEHCYLSAGEGVKGIIWSLSEFEAVANFIAEVVEQTDAYRYTDEINVRFSGGEPTLLGAKNLAIFSEKIYRKLPSVTLGIVSNFLSFTDDFISVAREFNWSVFASYDFGIRFPAGAKGFYLESLWRKRVEKAVNGGIRVILSVTLTKKAIEQADELVSLIRDLGIAGVYFAPFAFSGRAVSVYGELCPSREEVVDFVLNFLENNRGVKMLPFSDIGKRYVDFLRTGKGGCECWSDCFNDFGINPDLTVTSIGLCYQENFYGKIDKNRISESARRIINSESRRKFMEAKLFSDRKCLECEHYLFCRGGCFSFERHPFTRECRGLKTLLDLALKEG